MAQVLSCNRDGMEALRKGQTKAVGVTVVPWWSLVDLTRGTLADVGLIILVRSDGIVFFGNKGWKWMLLVHKHHFPGNWIWNISFSRVHLQSFRGVFGVFLVFLCFLESFKQTVRLQVSVTFCLAPALLFQCSKAFEQFKYAEAILIANQAESQESSVLWISGWIESFWDMRVCEYKIAWCLLEMPRVDGKRLRFFLSFDVRPPVSRSL